jgi:DNA-directed RNA polymerase specialized sigma subunit
MHTIKEINIHCSVVPPGMVCDDWKAGMAELVEQLTAHEKLVLSLYYADELNMREIAEVTGITEGEVSQLHSQALMRLHREFTARHGKQV